MKKASSKILLSLGVNIAIACIAIFIFGTYLYLGDDHIIGYMAYGIITEASSRVFYTNVILGWLYKHLFELIPEFNWQTLIYYLGLIYAGTVGLYSVFKRKNRVLVLLWFLFELVFFNDVYVYLTYSVVGAFAACQGYLALYLAISEKEKSVWQYIFAGISLVFSSMVRFDTFIGVSGFAFFVWLILVILDFVEKKETKDIVKRHVYPFVVIIGACFLLRALDAYSYSKGDWKAYQELESTRQTVSDHRNSASVMDFAPLEELGINESMTRAVVEWRNNDPEILTTDVLAIMSETSKDYNYLSSPVVWRDYFAQWKVIFTRYLEVYFALLTLGYLVYSVNAREGKIRKWAPLVLLLPFLGEFFYFAFIGRIDGGEYPERSIYVVLMGLAISAISLYGVFAPEEKSTQSITKGFMLALVLAAIIVQPMKDFSVKGLGLVETRPIRKQYGFLGNEGDVYVCEYDVRRLIQDSYSAWQSPREGFLDQTIVLGSWLVGHPMQKEQQEALETSNPYRALFEKDYVYYVCITSSADEVLRYLQDNYDSRITMSFVKEKGGLKLYQYKLE